MPVASLIFTYSLKVNTSLVLCNPTFTVPGKGVTLVSTGGMVSLGPPEGGVVVLAQPCGNMSEPSMRAAGMSGSSFFRLIVPF